MVDLFRCLLVGGVAAACSSAACSEVLSCRIVPTDGKSERPAILRFDPARNTAGVDFPHVSYWNSRKLPPMSFTVRKLEPGGASASASTWSVNGWTFWFDAREKDLFVMDPRVRSTPRPFDPMKHPMPELSIGASDPGQFSRWDCKDIEPPTP